MTGGESDWIGRFFNGAGLSDNWHPIQVPPFFLRVLLLFLLLFPVLEASARQSVHGQISGWLAEPSGAPLAGATIQLKCLSDSSSRTPQLAGKEGEFMWNDLPYGLYQLQLSFAGYAPATIDSIHVRPGKEWFSLGAITLRPGDQSSLGEVIIVAERPLMESKEGNITFNVAESPLAAGATADELLAQVPLVNKDADGKVTVRGKEPRILIDDKPVELNMQQLQELLESLPGSSIEKIEVLQNPPPQYANEQGGVINIVMKKGRVGKTARLNISGGTRGQAGASGSFNYRRSGLNFSLNTGIAYNMLRGNSHSYRENYFADSTNYFQTEQDFRNQNWRPNLRANLDYTINKYQSFTATLQANGNRFNNRNNSTYRNRNNQLETYRLSERQIASEGESGQAGLSASYQARSRRAGEQLRVMAGWNQSSSSSERDFYQQYFFPDYRPTGADSTQEQINDQLNRSWNLRINYDRPLWREKTFLSLGTFVSQTTSDVEVLASSFDKTAGQLQPIDALSNDFRFRQTLSNGRVGLRQRLAEGTSISAGVTAEQTQIHFDLYKTGARAGNRYWTILPYANFNRNFGDKLSLTFSYRRSIRRPGINELNPTIDFSDPYNIRFGNEKLRASTSDNFDLVLARNRRGGFINLGLGYNRVNDIFSRVRTLLEDGVTQLTWQNISGRSEYELSSWGGWTVNKRVRVNLSASYTYNQYSEHDRRVNRFRNGGSFTSNLNGTYTLSDRWSFTAAASMNRFASPQGYGRWTLGMNTGVQHKLLNKRMTLTFNMIDPFVQQRNRTVTYGTNFYLENQSLNRTRNFRLTIGYNLLAAAKK